MTKEGLETYDEFLKEVSGLNVENYVHGDFERAIKSTECPYLIKKLDELVSIRTIKR